MGDGRKDDGQRPRGAAETPADSELSRLVETEQRLEGMLKDARERALHIVQQARASVATAENGWQAELDKEVAAFRDEIDRDKELRLRELEEQQRSREARYEDADEAELERLAELVARRVIDPPT